MQNVEKALRRHLIYHRIQPARIPRSWRRSLISLWLCGSWPNKFHRLGLPLTSLLLPNTHWRAYLSSYVFLSFPIWITVNEWLWNGCQRSIRLKTQDSRKSRATPESIETGIAILPTQTGKEELPSECDEHRSLFWKYRYTIQNPATVSICIAFGNSLPGFEFWENYDSETINDISRKTKTLYQASESRKKTLWELPRKKVTQSSAAQWKQWESYERYSFCVCPKV